MHRSPLHPLFALVVALLLNATCFAAQWPTASRVAQLDGLVSLSPEQKLKAKEIFERERSALVALGANVEAIQGNMEARQRSRTEIRAILTPAQRRVYDRTRTGAGGGLTIPEPQTKVDRLDKEVGLSPGQKAAALLVFKEEFESLLALDPNERADAGAPFRLVAKNQIQAILTTAQLEKQKDTREAETLARTEITAAMKNALRVAPAVAARVGDGASYTLFSSVEAVGQPSKGEGHFKVTGAGGTAWFVVKWERAGPGSPIAIVGVTEASAEGPKS